MLSASAAPRWKRQINTLPFGALTSSIPNAVRRRKDAELDEEAAAAIEDTSDDPEVVLEKQDTGNALRQCIAALTPEHREVIDLVYYHEKSVEETAAIMRIPENTVKTRMFYARKKLAGLLKKAGVERGWP